MNKKVLFKALFLSLIGYAFCANSAVVLRDNFEYAVSKTDSGTCPLFSSSGGWAGVKSNNCTGRGAGYLYTTNTIPGYSGALPGSSSKSRPCY